MLFSCQLCYFNIKNWLSVYYDCRFAESVKFSAVFFFHVLMDNLPAIFIRWKERFYLNICKFSLIYKNNFVELDMYNVADNAAKSLLF